jgi:hypothetical protein
MLEDATFPHPTQRGFTRVWHSRGRSRKHPTSVGEGFEPYAPDLIRGSLGEKGERQEPQPVYALTSFL